MIPTKIEITSSELAFAINEHLARKFESKPNKGPYVAAIEFMFEHKPVSVPESVKITLTVADCGKTGLSNPHEGLEKVGGIWQVRGGKNE